MCVLSTFS